MKLDNILTGLVSTISVLAAAPFIIVYLVIHNIYLTIYVGSLDMMWEGIKFDMELWLGTVRMLGRIFKTGDTREAVEQFWEELETL